MAIWQYQIFIIPEEEINSYFEKESFINTNSLNEIKWWKYREVNIEDFNIFKSLLSIKDSWTKDIILFGDDTSNCIEILIDQKKTIEISARVDLRSDYKQFTRLLCEFAQKNRCIFLNNNLKIINPYIELLEQDIADYPVYKSFINKLK